MYRKIDPPIRLSGFEACEMFPDECVLVRADDRNPCNSGMVTVLFVGDDFYELFSLIKFFDDSNNCGVLEGANLKRRISLGGVVVET